MADRRIIAIHPPLFAAFPVLSLYSANLGMFNPSDLFRPLAVYIGVTVTIWLIVGAALKDLSRGAMAASTLAVCYVLYGKVLLGEANTYAEVVWGLLSVTLAALAAWKLRGTLVLNVLGAFLVLTSVGSIALGTWKAHEVLAARRPPLNVKPAGPDAPDIYYIILDGYGRHDSLEQFLDYSNAGFLTQLRSRGFYIADRSHSNYVQTEISIPSSLNLDFIQTLVPGMDPTAIERVTLDHLAQHNELSRQLTARGYGTVLVTSGFPPLQHIAADQVFRGPENESLFESTLSQASPLASRQSDDQMYDQRREQLLGAYATVKKLGGRQAQPRFFFIHILAPHPPFVFDEHGRSIRPRYQFGLWDGSDFVAAGSTREEYKRGYVGQVQTINRLTLDLVDALLSKKGVKPVIVLQGDHGSKRFLDQNDLSQTDVRECFSNLAAIYAPKAVSQLLYPEITPVNEFRVVLNGLFDARFPLLPDESWYSPYHFPYRFTDVTKQVVAYAEKAPISVADAGRRQPHS